jgi:HEPN domain-containing protein
MVGVDYRSIVERARRELSLAHEARRNENEGRARVHARRAAGWAARIHYRRVTGAEAPRSALALLHWLQSECDIQQEVREAAMRLTVHVTPAHELPFDADPLLDATHIVETLSARGR